jgi:hypothetical protein
VVALPTQTVFSCRIELSKSDGITIVIKDGSQPEQVQRKVVLGPTSIQLVCQKSPTVVTTVTLGEGTLKTECKTDKGTTTIDQDGEQVKVVCKTFEVAAETITLKATGDGRLETGGTCTLKSTKDALVDSAAKLTLTSVQAMALDGKADVSMTAVAKLALTGNQTEIKGTASLAAASDGTATVDGMTVAVKGETQLTLEAPLTSLGKESTTVKGQIVEISGSLVKIG